MSKGTRAPVTKHRTLWISDVHLGSPGSKAKLLTDFLNRNDCEQLYLVGDIFDGWKMKANFYWTPDHSRVIRAIISKARKGTKVYYLAGNHDDFMRQFIRSQLRLGKVRLANEVVHTTADGRRLLVLHGDSFDEVVTGFPLLAHLGDAAYESLMWATQRMNQLGERFGVPYWSLSAFAKTHVKAAVQYLSGFDEKVLCRCKRDDLHGVVCGHTHHAEARELRGGVMSYNCGDWVESCTALGEDFDGRIRIIDGTKAEQPLSQVAVMPPFPEPPHLPLPLVASGSRQRRRVKRSAATAKEPSQPRATSMPDELAAAAAVGASLPAAQAATGRVSSPL